MKIAAKWYWFKQGFKKEFFFCKRIDMEMAGRLCASALLWALAVVATGSCLGIIAVAIFFMATY